MTILQVEMAHRNNFPIYVFGGEWHIAETSKTLHPRGLMMHVTMVRTDKPGELEVDLYEDNSR